MLDSLKINNTFTGPDKFNQALLCGENAIRQGQCNQFEIHYDSSSDVAVTYWDKISQLSDFAKLYGPGDVPGYLSDGDLQVISTLCELAPDNGLLVEVGSFLGKSAVEWASNFQRLKKNYKIICIDSFNAKIDIIHELLTEAQFDIPPGNTNLEIFKHYIKNYPNIVPVEAFFQKDFQFDQPISFLFEDSDHTIDTLSYALPFWWDRLINGGIFAGHDYHLRPVKTSVDIFAALHNLEIKTFPNSTIWYTQKIC